jgi:hypothetical protein
LKNSLWFLPLFLAAASARAADHPCQGDPHGPWDYDKTLQFLGELRSLSADARKLLPAEEQGDLEALNGRCASFSAPDPRALEKRQACGDLVDRGIVMKAGVRDPDDSGVFKRVHELDGGEFTSRLSKNDVQEVMEQVCSAYAQRQAAAQLQAQAKAEPTVDTNEEQRRARQLLDEICHSFGGCPPSGPTAAPAAPQQAPQSPGLTFRDLPQCGSVDCVCLCKNARAACGEQGPTNDRPGCTTQFSNAASCNCW